MENRTLRWRNVKETIEKKSSKKDTQVPYICIIWICLCNKIENQLLFSAFKFKVVLILSPYDFKINGIQKMNGDV